MHLTCWTPFVDGFAFDGVARCGPSTPARNARALLGLLSDLFLWLRGVRFGRPERGDHVGLTDRRDRGRRIQVG